MKKQVCVSLSEYLHCITFLLHYLANWHLLRDHHNVMYHLHEFQSMSCLFMHILLIKLQGSVKDQFHQWETEEPNLQRLTQFQSYTSVPHHWLCAQLHHCHQRFPSTCSHKHTQRSPSAGPSLCPETTQSSLTAPVPLMIFTQPVKTTHPVNSSRTDSVCVCVCVRVCVCMRACVCACVHNNAVGGHACTDPTFCFSHLWKWQLPLATKRVLHSFQSGQSRNETKVMASWYQPAASCPTSSLTAEI